MTTSLRTAPAPAPDAAAWVSDAALPAAPLRSPAGHRPSPTGIAREDGAGYDADLPEDEPGPEGDSGPDLPASVRSEEGPDGSVPAPDGRAAGPRPVGVPATPAEVAAAVATIVASDERGVRCDGELAELAATMRAADRLMQRAVRLAGELDGRRAAAEEGMTVDGALRLHTAAAGPDVSMVLTAAEVLRTMPATAGLFSRGILSWGQVRQLVVRARRMPVDTRTRLDHHLEAHAGQLEKLDPERRAWAIEDALDDHTPERTLERRAERAEQAESLALQGRLDGTGSVYGEYGAEGFALLNRALDAEADAPRARPCPGDRDSPADEVPTRGQQLAAALLRILGRTPGTGSGSGGSGPVRFTVIVDLGRICDTAAGEIQAGVRGRPPRVVRRALDRLSCDAALDVVVRDGADLLAAQRYAPEVTAATRRAVIARDAGCRFPACTAPASWCDVHHVVPRATGDDHAVSNLLLLCRRHHTTIHRRGWHQTLTPDGTYTIRRRGRSWTTLPRRDHHLPPPTPPGGPSPRGGPSPPERDGPDLSDGPSPPGGDGPESLEGPAPPGGPDPPDAPDLPDLPEAFDAEAAGPDDLRRHRPGPPLPF